MFGKYLEISSLKTLPKTSVYTVKIKQGGSVLGIIRWHGPWRRYVFEVGETFFDEGCLQDLVNFMGQKMRERAAQQPASKEK